MANITTTFGTATGNITLSLSAPDPAVAGTTETYQFIIVNGTSSDLTGLSFTDSASAGVTGTTWQFDSVHSSVGDSVSSPSGTGFLQDTLKLPAGDTAIFDFTVQIDPNVTVLFSTASR
jgi:hypothetical protein